MYGHTHGVLHIHMYIHMHTHIYTCIHTFHKLGKNCVVNAHGEYFVVGPT